MEVGGIRVNPSNLFLKDEPTHHSIDSISTSRAYKTN